MRQLQQDFGSGEVELAEVPRPACQSGGVLVETRHSLVSAGTERAMADLAQKTLVGKALERPDLVREVVKKARQDGLTSTYRSVQARLDEPRPVGYSCAGEVVAVGDDVTEFSVGDTVACGGAGYASHAEVNYVPENLCTSIPAGVETRAVAGANVRAGAVIGQDDIEARVDSFTDGTGVDGVLIAAATDSDEPIELAGEICRDRATVSVVGDVGMDIPRDSYYEKELEVRVSCSYGPGRYDRRYEELGLDYPIEFVRWTENRNMGEFLRLVAEDRVTVSDLITHTYKVANALEAYDLILDGTEPYVGVVIEYEDQDDTVNDDRIALVNPDKRTVDSDTLQVGLVGSGTFATSTLLPVIDDLDGLSLHAVATASGESARETGEKYGAQYATTDYSELITDDEIDLLVVATRHGTHAEIAIEALTAGVDVHVEKPIGLDADELAAVVEAEQASSARLMIGYNRRFSAAAMELNDRFADPETPVVAQYRINTDRLPEDHWVYDSDAGGGRIVGEVCHFVDFLQYVTGERPETVFAASPSIEDGSRPDDNVQCVVQFDDGSQATITYTSMGDDSVAKERVEIFGDDGVEVVDNFKGGRLKLRQDKGFSGEFEAFADAIRSGDRSPIPMADIVATSRTTFAIEMSLRTGGPVPIEQPVSDS